MTERGRTLTEGTGKGRAVSEWVMAGVVILSCLHGEAAHFSWLMMLFLPFLFWDLYQSRREGRPLWPRMTAEAKGMSRAILLFYGALLGISLIQLDGSGADRAVMLSRLTLPFFMMVYIEGKYPGGRGFVWGIGASVFVLALTGLAMGSGEHPGRFQSFFAHPNNFALILSLVMPMGAYFAWRARHPAIRWSFAAALLGMLFCLIKTDSRTSMGALTVGAVLAILLMIWLHRRDLSIGGKRWAAAATAVILLVGGGVLWEMQSHRTGMGRFGYERIYMWEASYEMWKDHKWFGVGLDNWRDAYYSPRYHPEKAREQGMGFPHSMPAYFFSTAGTVGGGAFLIFLGYTFRILWRHARRAADKAFSLVLLTTYFIFFLAGFFDATFTMKAGSLTYYTFLGYGSMAGRIRES